MGKVGLIGQKFAVVVSPQSGDRVIVNTKDGAGGPIPGIRVRNGRSRADGKIELGGYVCVLDKPLEDGGAAQRTLTVEGPIGRQPVIQATPSMTA